MLLLDTYQPHGWTTGGAVLWALSYGELHALMLMCGSHAADSQVLAQQKCLAVKASQSTCGRKTKVPFTIWPWKKMKGNKAFDRCSTINSKNLKICEMSQWCNLARLLEELSSCIGLTILEVQNTWMCNGLLILNLHRSNGASGWTKLTSYTSMPPSQQIDALYALV